MTSARSILFVTSLSLTANPRLVKELELAIRSGYHVTVVFFRIGNWGDENDLLWMRRHPSVRCIRLSALRRPFVIWLLSSILEAFARFICRFVDVTAVNAMAAGKRYLLLRRAVARLEGPFDWVVAHNPAAFHAAMWVAQHTGARLGIDVEDYHPAETADLHQAKALRSLMRECLSKSYYVSYASPLIREACDRETAPPIQTGLVVLNSFPRSEFPEPLEDPEGPLRLVWFSQHINAGRGLELVLPAIASHLESVELHLYGIPNPAFQRDWLEGQPNIRIHGTLPQQSLHDALCRYDIGLAVDVLSDANRDLVITNKILAYLQSGLYLAVTDTRAQRRLLAEYPGHGVLFAPNPESFSQLLSSLLADPAEIRRGRRERYQAVSGLDWAYQSLRLAEIWQVPGSKT